MELDVRCNVSEYISEPHNHRVKHFIFLVVDFWKFQDCVIPNSFDPSYEISVWPRGKWGRNDKGEADHVFIVLAAQNVGSCYGGFTGLVWPRDWSQG